MNQVRNNSMKYTFLPNFPKKKQKTKKPENALTAIKHSTNTGDY